jgi:hypothetical protein
MSNKNCERDHDIDSETHICWKCGEDLKLPRGLSNYSDDHFEWIDGQGDQKEFENEDN